MNILLIYPEFPDTFWSFKHALKFIRKKSAAPPLGLLTVAAMLPADWDTRLVDLNLRPLSDKDLAWADYAFISAMTVQRQSARIVAERCRAADVKVVAGGPLFTIEPEQFEDVVDHFVLNEGELTLPPFLADLAQGHARHTYTSQRLPRSEPDTDPALGTARFEAVRHDQHPVLARLSVQLRLLQRDRAVGPPAAHQDRATDHRRAGQPLSRWAGAATSSSSTTT